MKQKQTLMAAGLVMTIITALAIAFLSKTPHPVPAALIALPEFRLTDQRGIGFGTKELDGKVWVADFMFTNCPTVCPKLTAHMKRLTGQLHDLEGRIHFVSFTVDPLRDTPAVLARFGADNDIDPRSWSLLTGDLRAVETAVVQGFKMPMGEPEAVDVDVFDITHGTRFVLVGPDRHIYGFYDALPADLDRLVDDARALAAVPTPAPIASAR